MSLPLVYHPDYVSPLPEGHRFPMPKFGKLYEVLLRDGIATLDQFHCPPLATRTQVQLAHDAEYVDAYMEGLLDARQMRRIGLPWSPALVNRTLAALGGSIEAARLALQHGIACNLAGGTHHAHADFGSGFCIFNDLGVVPRVLQSEGLVQRVLIVDLDVHQGDGSAAIFAQDASVFTFSMHCAINFPFRKQTSDCDVELPQGMEDAAYLRTLADHLPDLLESVRPDLVLYDGGVDPHKDDKLGKLQLSDEGLYARDHYALSTITARGIPVACVIGGGYSGDILALARRHAILMRAAGDVFEAI